MNSPSVTLERYAEMRAEMEAGRLREEVLARAGLTVDEWVLAQREWLEKMGMELERGRFELTNRYTQVFLERQRELKRLATPASELLPLIPEPPIVTAHNKPMPPVAAAEVPPSISNASPQSPLAGAAGPRAPLFPPSPAPSPPPFLSAPAVSPTPEPAVDSTTVTLSADLFAPLAKDPLPFRPSSDGTPLPLARRGADGALPFQPPASNTALSARGPSAPTAESAGTEPPPSHALYEPALPFQPSTSMNASASAPISRPLAEQVPPPFDIESGTGTLAADLTAPLVRQPLPFQASTGSVPLPGPQGPPLPVRPPLSHGGTQQPHPTASLPTPQDTGAPRPPIAPPQRLPTLTLDQYASLCAALAVYPQQKDAIFARHNLGARQDQVTLDHQWQERLRRNPTEYREWNVLYQRWYVYWLEQARRGR